MTLRQKMPAIPQLNLRLWQVTLERLGARRDETHIVLAPYRQQRHLRLPEILLPHRVQLHVALVVVEEVEEDLILPRSLHERPVQPVARRIDGVVVGGAGEVLVPDRVEIDALLADGLAQVTGGVRPVRAHGFPWRAETLVVRVAILRDDGLHGTGAGRGDAQTDGRAVVEDIDGEFVEREGVEELSGGFGEVGEGVVVAEACRNFSEAEGREVRGNHSVTCGSEGRDEVAVLVRRAGIAVKEEDGCAGLWSGDSVEDLDAVCESGEECLSWIA